MVLDTKSRNINLIKKIIAVVLSLIMLFGAIYSTISILSAVDFYGWNEMFNSDSAKENYDFTKTTAFRNTLNEDIYHINALARNKSTTKLQGELLGHKDEFVQYALDEYKTQKDETINNIKSSPAEYLDGYDFYEDSSLFYENAEQEYAEEIDDILTKTDLSLSFSVPIGDTTYILNDDKTINLGADEKTVEEKAEKMYNRWVSSDYITDMEYDSTWLEGNTEDLFDISEKNLYFYVKNNHTDAVVSNLPDGMKPEDVASKKYSLISTDQKVTLGDGMKGYRDGYHSDFENLVLFSDEIDAYLYIDDTFAKDDYYKTIYYNNESLGKTNYTALAVIAVLCTIGAIATAVYSFVKCGRKQDNGKVKLSFIDYVPTDLHIALTAAAVFGLGICINLVFGEARYHEIISFYNTAAFYSALICTLIWTLFIELVTSFIRVCKSEKPLYRNLLVFHILRIIGLAFRALFRGIRKLFEYKLYNFKKKLIIFITGYIALTCLLLILIISSFFYEAILFAFICMLHLLAMNILAAVFVAKYAKQLDNVIIASNTRDFSTINYDKLYPSLQHLVDSFKFTQQELDVAVEKAVRDERMRTELITNVSHDLKTPLTSIINYVDLLQKCDINDKDATEYLGVLEEKSSKLKRLIDDLVEASKVTSGVIKLNPINLNMTELVSQAIVENQQEFADRHLELVYDFNGDTMNVFADGNKTYRIIENLLSNARKYSATNSRVYAKQYSVDDMCVFELKNVSAQPLNITPQELTERFVRGDKSRNTEGNGLGLSIADSLCKAQNGKLDIQIDGDLFKAIVYLPKNNTQQ